MSMTREELLTEVARRIDTDEGKGHPADWTAKHILALFDRYEREQWGKAGEAPSGSSRDVLMYTPEDGMIVFFWKPDGRWFKHERFRELPPGPTEEE